MTYPFLLLPRGDYWTWVRASRAFVLAFGANISPEAEGIVRAPLADVSVTYPNGRALFPELGDSGAWLSARRPSLRLNPISANTPEEFADALQARVEAGDPYGETRLPISLTWPTDYSVITQPFGANPQIYARYGLPGHEGVDFRALGNTNVYAASPGEVYEVHPSPGGHVYGIFVRIRHGGGFKSTYAHLARPLVRVGETVQAGQLIGKADSTGASNASHLHLLLKKDGATDRRETTFPRDIVDPTPYLVWPASTAKRLGRSPWAPHRCLWGAVGRPGDILRPADLDLALRARLEAIAIERTERSETVRRWLQAIPGIQVLARISVDPVGDPSAVSFLERTQPDVSRLYAAGVRLFEIQPNPNLQSQGWGWGWQNGAEFGAWFESVVQRLREEHTEAQFGFPCLSPGAAVTGLRLDASHFLEQADPVAAAADWIGVAAFWQSAQDLSGDEGGGTSPDAYRDRFPRRLLFVTEFGNAAPGVTHEDKAEQYLAFHDQLQGIPGIGGAFAYCLSSPNAHPSLVWRSEAGMSLGLAEALGRRAAPPT